MLAIAPGPDNLFVLVQSAVYGVKPGLVIVLGLMTGIFLQTLAAALGVAAVVAASPVLFWGIRLLGAAYLLYLAFMSWTHPVSGSSNSEAFKNKFSLYKRGLIMNVTNPKVQIFFLAFFPQFVTQNVSSAQTAFEMVLLGITFALVTAFVFGTVAILSGSIADFLRNERVQFYLNRTAAVIFLALALSTVFI